MQLPVIDYLTIRSSGLFDSRFYLTQYQEVRLADIDPLWHFVRHGWKEGRNPSEEFNTVYYLETYADVRDTNINPLVHYIRYGYKEGRRKSSNDALTRSSINGGYKNKSILKQVSMKNIRRAFRHWKMYGFTSLLTKIKSTILIKPNVDINNGGSIFSIHEGLVKSPSIDTENALIPYDSIISIIIPTKNAGDDFELTLKMLKNQTGFKDIEIIIIDSGSNDNTIQFANRYNAKIIRIAAEEFSHSYARNLGAEHASGDYLLFTVQDALPPTKSWLYELMTVLNDNDVGAVSCAEFPREDADLFYRVISWNHYNFLGVNNGDRIFKLPTVADFISLRQNGQLSDLACLIPNQLFKQYKYRFNYAEDLDLGIRLVKDGFQIAFLGSTRIIHSHLRPAFYYLKRGYVDNLFLSDMFSDLPIPKIELDELISETTFAYYYLNDVIIPKISSMRLPEKAGLIEEIIREGFKSVNQHKYPSANIIKYNQYVDYEFTDFLKNLVHRSGTKRMGAQYNGFLMDSLMNYTNLMLDYLHRSYEIIDVDLVEEINRCLYKELAILIGAHLAHCYINGPKTDETAKYHTVLSEGV